jgi:hypothetical protein
MPTDLYTKVVLSVIAGALVFNAVHSANIASAGTSIGSSIRYFAENSSCGRNSGKPCYIASSPPRGSGNNVGYDPYLWIASAAPSR